MAHARDPESERDSVMTAADQQAVSALSAGAEWLQEAALKALRQILPMLAHRSRTAITAAGLPAAGNLLLVGAAGTGSRRTHRPIC